MTSIEAESLDKHFRTRPYNVVSGVDNSEEYLESGLETDYFDWLHLYQKTHSEKRTNPHTEVLWNMAAHLKRCLERCLSINPRRTSEQIGNVEWI
jgi:hypothetical protein